MINSSERAIEETPPVNAERHTPAIPLETSQQQLLPPGKFISHHPKCGLNPLVDAAAYLFSIIGKLKQLKSYRYLNKLHQELLHEMKVFQEVAKAHGYSSEYILVSRYALFATLDDIIANTLWGSQGQWDSFSLLATLKQEPVQQDRFFVILDRIVKEPTLYIDVMELMYICLSLGYKGTYRLTEYSHNQLELIINSLYKHIRTFRGDFTKVLSPFPMKPSTSSSSPIKKTPIGLIVLVTLGIIVGLFSGLAYTLETISSQTYQELTHIGKSILYEPHDS